MNAPRKHLVWIPVLLTVVDRIITIPNYHLEANPLVTQLGPSMWIVVTVVFLLSMILVWYRWKLYWSDIAVVMISFYTALVTLVLIANIYILAFVA